LNDDWRAFTLSHFRGEAALKPVQASLKGYKLQTDASPVSVTSPKGNKFDCYGSSSGY
jgi:hypothetical protein